MYAFLSMHAVTCTCKCVFCIFVSKSYNQFPSTYTYVNSGSTSHSISNMCFRLVTVGKSEVSARIRVQRVQGIYYNVSVVFTTRMMNNPITESGITVTHALEGDDYVKQTGVLVFGRGSQVDRYLASHKKK